MRAADLVAIAGADAAHRGADRLAAGEASVHRAVFGDVPRKDHVGPIADHQILAACDAAGRELSISPSKLVGLSTTPPVTTHCTPGEECRWG